MAGSEHTCDGKGKPSCPGCMAEVTDALANGERWQQPGRGSGEPETVIYAPNNRGVIAQVVINKN